LRQDRKQRLSWPQFLIAGFTVCAVAGTLLLGWRMQLETKRLATEQFNRQQLTLARSAATSIEGYFKSLITELKSTAKLPPVQQMSRECPIYLQHAYSSFPEGASVRRLDRNGILRFIYPFDGWREGLIGRDYASDEFFQKAMITGCSSVSGVIVNEQGETRIRAAVPVYAESKTETVEVGDTIGATLSPEGRHEEDRRSFEGVLVGSFDLSTIQRIISPVVSGMTGYAWLLNHEGIALAHHEKAFVGRSAMEARQKMNPEISYEGISRIEQQMMAGEEGTGSYISGWHRGRKGELEKLVAYTPVHINEEVWSVAVCAPIDEVEQVVGNVKGSELLTLGFVVLVLLVGGGLLLVMSYRWSRYLEAQVSSRTKELRETASFLNGLIRHANAPIIVWDPKGKVTIFNSAFEEMSGRTEAEMIGKPLDILFPEESRSACLERIEAASAGEFWQTVEIPILRKDGEVRVALWNSANIYTEDGEKLIATVAQGHDITDRKLAEKRIERLNLVLRTIRKVNQIITQKKDRNQLIEEACANLTKNRGYYHAWIALLDRSGVLLGAAESGLRTDFHSMIDLLKRGELTQCARTALKRTGVVAIKDVRHICKGCPLSSQCVNRGAFVVQLGYRGEVYGLLSVSIPTTLASDEEERSLFMEAANDLGYALHDIEMEDRRKRAEEALRISEERLELALSGAGLSTWDWNVQTGELGTGLRWPSSLGYSPDEIERHTRSWEDLIHPDDIPGRAESLRAHLAGETSFYESEYRVRAKSGEYRWIASRGRVVSRAENNDPIQMAGTNLDVTERKQAGEALRESEERFRAAFEQAFVGIAELSPSGSYLRVNRRFREIVGYTKEKLITLSFQQITHPDDLEADVAQFKQLVAGDIDSYSMEKRYTREDSAIVWVHLTTSLVRSSDGSPMYAVAVTNDITERKRVEEALRKSEARFRSLTDDVLDSSGVGVMILNADFRVVWVNQAFQRFFGLGSDELVGRDKRELIRGKIKQILDDPDGFAEKVLATYDDNTYVERFECRVLPVAGRDERWLEHWSQPIRSGLYAGGRIEHYYDITERKNAERALRASEERYHSVFENTGAATCIVEEDMTLSMVNAEMARTVGRSKDEIEGKMRWTEFILATDSNKMREYHEARRRYVSEAPTDYEIRFLDGKNNLRHGILTVDMIPGTNKSVASLIDITELKRAEASVCIQRDLALALNSASNLQDALSLCLDTAIEASGLDGGGIYLVDEDAGLSLAIHKELSEDFVKSVEHFDIGSSRGRLVMQGKPVFSQLEKLHIPSDELDTNDGMLALAVLPISHEGRVIACLNLASYSLDEVPMSSRTILESIAAEIGGAIARISAQDALRDSEKRYRLLAENISDVIWVMDLKTMRMRYVSLSVTRLTGFTVDEAMSHTMEDSLSPGALEVAQAALKDEMEVEKSQQKDLRRSRTLELEMRCKDGNVIWTESRMTFLRDDNSEPVAILGVTRDISEHKQAEERLLQAEKMEAIGRLAGGIAHDFNNILTAIIGNLNLLKMDIPEAESVPNEIEEIGAAATRAADLTEQLLAFSRKQIVTPRAIDLNHAITDLRKMLKRLIREDVEIETLLERSLPSIKMDSTQLQQIVLNLSLNARDAMVHGGKLTIETKAVLRDEEYQKSHQSVAPGRYVMLTVSDTGEGMAPETLAHVFEPFYTTKDVGRGVGLGLSTVYGIVKQAGGHITVYSEKGKGSCFRICFPAIEERTILTGKVEVEPESLASRGETILVVEDDEAVKALIERILAKAGYEVESASGSAEAIAICEEPGKSIDLLLTDVVMPDMQGRDLASILCGRRPNLKALFMSGYTANVIAHLGVLDEGIEFISKPFSSEDVLRKIRKLLNK